MEPALIIVIMDFAVSNVHSTSLGAAVLMSK